MLLYRMPLTNSHADYVSADSDGLWWCCVRQCRPHRHMALRNIMSCSRVSFCAPLQHTC